MATISTDSTYSAISSGYSDNELLNITNGAKLTMDQSTVDLRYVRCTTFGECLVKNTSTTTPIIIKLGSTGANPQWRFEGAGINTIEGEWITLGTGNGVAGQVFNVPLAQGPNGVGTQSLPDVGFLWINGTDTLRDGTAIPRLALSVDAGGYTNATDHEFGGNVFQHDTSANTVTFKRAVPVGQAVYMPNIFFTTGASFTSNEFSWDFQASGQVNMDKCVWSGKFSFAGTAAKQLTFSNCSFASTEDFSFILTNQIQAPSLTSCGIKIAETTGAGFNLSNSARAGTHKNLWVETALVGNHTSIQGSATSQMVVEKAIITCYLAGTTAANVSGSRGAVQVNSPDCIVYDIYDFTYSVVLSLGSGASNAIVDNINFEIGCRSDVAFQTVKRVVVTTGSVSNGVFTNIHQIKTTNSYSNNIFITVGAGASNNLFNNITVRSGASGSGDNRWDNIVSDNGSGNKYNNIIVHGYIKDRVVAHSSNSLGMEVSNIYFVEKQAESNQTASITVGARTKINQVYLNDIGNGGEGIFGSSAVGSGVDSLSVMGIRNTADGGTVEKVDGLFCMRFSPTQEETDYYTADTQTGVIVFNNNNRLYIQNSGDVVELQSFVHNNVSSIASDITRFGSTVNQFTVTVKMRRPEGTYTSYVASTQSAMQTAYATLAADSLNRVQFKLRIEKTVTNLSSYLDRLIFNCTLTGDDYPFIRGVDVKASALIDGTRARLYNVTTSTELDNSVVSGGSGYVKTVDLFDTNINVGDTLRLTATYVNGTVAKKEFSALGVLTSTGLTIINTQEDDTIYNALAVDGSTISKFNADYVDNEVDLVIGTDWTMSELYAWWSYNLTTEQGIRQFFEGITAIDEANFRINSAIVNLFLDNTTSASYKQTDNRRFFRDTGDGYPIKEPTTSGYGLDAVWRNQVSLSDTDEILEKINKIEKRSALIPALL